MTNFTLETASHNDAETLAHIHVAGWRAAYEGLVNPEYLDNLSVAERTENWKTWIDNADGMTVTLARASDGTAAGFASFGKLRTPIPGGSPIRPLYSAELYALYILPDYWRQGLGKILMQDAVTKLQDQRHKSLCLWVLEKNPRAVPFYKAMGGERCGKKMVEIGGRDVKEIALGWRKSAVILER